MGGGVLSGLAIGLAVSVLVLAAVSLNTPLPERPAMAVVPAEAPTSEPDDAPQDDPAAAPAVPDPIEAPPAGSGDAPAPDMPTAPEPPEPSDPETEAADTTVETERAAETAVDAETPEGLATASTDGAARIALPQIDTSPETPAPAMPPQVGAESQDPPVAGTASAPAPRIAAAPAPMLGALPAAPSPRFIAGTEAAPSGTAPRRLALPQVAEAPATADTAPAPQPAPAAETEEPDVPRRPTLPQVVDAPDAPAQAAPQAAASDESVATLPRRIAVPQGPARGRPRLSPEAATLVRGCPQNTAAARRSYHAGAPSGASLPPRRKTAPEPRCPRGRRTRGAKPNLPNRSSR